MATETVAPTEPDVVAPTLFSTVPTPIAPVAPAESVAAEPADINQESWTRPVAQASVATAPLPAAAAPSTTIFANIQTTPVVAPAVTSAASDAPAPLETPEAPIEPTTPADADEKRDTPLV